MPNIQSSLCSKIPKHLKPEESLKGGQFTQVQCMAFLAINVPFLWVMMTLPNMSWALVLCHLIPMKMLGGRKCRLLCGKEELGLRVAEAVPPISSQALPSQLTASTLPTVSITVRLWEPALPRGMAGHKPLEPPSANEGDSASLPQLLRPQVGRLGGTCLPLPPRGPQWDYLQLPIVVTCWVRFLPGITSQIRHLPSNPCLGVCFWPKPNQERVLRQLARDAQE